MGAVGLTISLAVGYDNFEELLEGANEMDTHLKRLILINMPVILALLSVWYNNFLWCRNSVITIITEVKPYLQHNGVMAKV
jgi:glucose-6-phosphate isomerase